jgi:glycine/D-amino acid oxidase-like deaminating enzyme
MKKYDYVFVIFFFILSTNCQKVKVDKFTDNNSYWAKTEIIGVNPAINSDLNVDFAIIGGGLTGLSAAYHLAKMFPNIKIVLFEAKTVGNGASGRNGGMLLPSLIDEYYDLETLAWNYEISIKSLNFIDSLAKALQMPCDLELNGYCEVIVYEQDTGLYKDYIKQANMAGIPLEYWDKQKTKQMLGTDYYYGAMYDPNGGSVHPMKLIHLLKTAAEQEGVVIYENSPVTQIKQGETIKLTVQSNNETFNVNAKNIVVATNAYTSKLGIFKHKIMPIHTQTAVTQQLTQAQLDAIQWKSRLPFYDSRIILYHLVLTPDNRIVIGGGNVDYNFANGLEYKGNIAQVADEILEELVRIYPALKGVKIEYIWDGLLGTTYDEVEMVGVTGDYHNIYYGLAYNGHGVNQSVLFGDFLAYLYAGKYHGWEDTEYYGYQLSNIPPEPFRFVGANIIFKYWKWKDRH